MAPVVLGFFVLLAVLYFSTYSIKQYERGVLLQFGVFKGIKKPGLRFIIPLVNELTRVDTRTITMDVPPQDIITRDNVSIKVTAVLYFSVVDPEKAVLAVASYLYATGQIAQTTLRSVCGQADLDDLLSKREEINQSIQVIIDRHTEPWGIKVSVVEVKDIDLPQDMQRAMARQAEAERERRAKIIQAEGEFEAAAKITAAAEIMAAQPGSMQLRYLETLKQISAEHNSTILFPIPMNLIEFFNRALPVVKNAYENPDKS